jgi:hypothetical protein
MIMRLSYILYLGILSCMSLPMTLQGTRTGQQFSTLLALIGFVTSVNSFMFWKATATNESFATLLTYVGLLFTLILLMSLRLA